jgi:hypothetical protein
MSITAPSAMTEAARFAELAELLARGVQRHFANEIKASMQRRISNVRLDEVAPAEAQCGSDVLNPKSMEHAQ